MTQVASWGRLGQPEHVVTELDDVGRAARVITEGAHPGLAHGMGRSYGDVCLNPDGELWKTKGLDRFISFDKATGRLWCESGVLLRDIHRMSLPRGWRLPVTPGTQMVTVGGAIANDIHGKNHHVLGTFGDHVHQIKLLRTDGQIILCSPVKERAWFEATVGGLGLTGVILEAEIQLRRVAGPWLDTEKIPFSSVDEFLQISQDSERGWEHTVAWIDCLGAKGRGIFMRANPTTEDFGSVPKRNTRSFCVEPPVSLVGGVGLRAFNTAYYYLNKWRAGAGHSDYESFLYPLDNLHHWNRMYGPKGFYQYQCVVPNLCGREAIYSMLEAISKSGQGSFLAVLKTFGERDAPGMLSFPMPGITLALDFANRGDATLALFKRLDTIVRYAGGRLYAAKDARMPRELFELGYPRLGEFLKYRDPGISSSLSRRLLGS